MLAGNNNKYYYISNYKKEIETANGLLCHCVLCVCKFCVYRVSERKKKGRERKRGQKSARIKQDMVKKFTQLEQDKRQA